MHKIISENGVFRVKELDANGNSVQIHPQEFVTEADAQKFIDTELSTNQSVGHQSTDQSMGARAEGSENESGLSAAPSTESEAQ